MASWESRECHCRHLACWRLGTLAVARARTRAMASRSASSAECPRRVRPGRTVTPAALSWDAPSLSVATQRERGPSWTRVSWKRGGNSAGLPPSFERRQQNQLLSPRCRAPLGQLQRSESRPLGTRQAACAPPRSSTLSSWKALSATESTRATTALASASLLRQPWPAASSASARAHGS